MNIGERIKKCRQEAGWSQEKVAEQLGVSRQSVTKWESGQSMPSTSNLFQLAKLVGTTVDFLTKEEQPPVPQKERVIIKTVYVEKKPEEKPEEKPDPKWVGTLKWVSMGCFIVAFFTLIAWFMSYTYDDYDLMLGTAYITEGLMFVGWTCQIIRFLGHRFK